MLLANTFPFRKTWALLSRLGLLLLCLSFLASCGSQKTIVHGLDEKDANDIVVFLDNKGIEAFKVQAKEATGGGGTHLILWDISVNAERATEAMALLNSAGLPRRQGQSLLSIFSKGGLVPSEMEEKIKYQAGLGEQIANVIRKIDGVLDADVQLSFPEQDPLNPNAPKQNVTASVYVKHTGVLDDPNAHLITKIRRLVSSSIQGLSYDNVTVIPDRTRISETTFKTPGGGGLEEKDYLSIWSIIIAKDSAFKFRMVFFSFLSVILILFTLLLWMLWKFYPLVSKIGGIKQLLNIHPVHIEKIQELLKDLPPPAEKKEEKKEENPEEPPKENDSGETP